MRRFSIRMLPALGTWAIWLLLAAQASTARAGDAAPAEVLEFGEFALFLPAEVRTLRGLLLPLGGPDTRAFVTDGAYGAPIPELEAALHAYGQSLRALAVEQGLAILGTRLSGEDGLPNTPATDGTLFGAIEEAAELSGHPELRTVPLLVYGISGGTPQAIGFVARHPERAAALLLKVPAPPQRLDNAAALAVPTYLLLAEQETFADNREVTAVFESNRRAGGLWALATEPGVPHHSLTAAHRSISVDWLRAVAGLRLAAAVGESLRTIPEASGWLGHPDIGVADWASYAGERDKASWFPSRRTAEEWWQFVQGTPTR